MKKRFLARFAIGLFVLGVANISSAALINEEVPGNAYITIGNYDVAWASPASNHPDDRIDLSFQSQFGWEIMSEYLFKTLDIDAFDFVVEGGNVDFATAALS